MFENLHDPIPPTGDSSQFAAVSERAQRIRTRRMALGSSIGAATLVIAGGIVIANTNSGGTETVLTPVAPSTDVVLTNPPPTSTVSTVSIPTTTSPDSTATSVIAETTVPAVPVPPATAPATTTTIPLVTPERILVAVDAAGDAIYFPSSASAPVELFDGPDPDAATGDGPSSAVERVVVSPDESTAYVSTCCEPILGAMFKTRPPTSAAFGDAQSNGYSPSIDPTGQLVAIAQFEGSLTVERLDGSVVATSTTINDGSESFSPWDLMWIDSNTIAMLGVVDQRFDVRFFVFDGTAIAPAGAVILGLFEPTASYSFAGVFGPYEFGVHLRGTDTVRRFEFLGVDSGADGIELASVTLPAPALNTWTLGNQLIYVDTNRKLTVNGTELSGDYLWARL